MSKPIDNFIENLEHYIKTGEWRLVELPTTQDIERIREQNKQFVSEYPLVKIYLEQGAMYECFSDYADENRTAVSIYINNEQHILDITDDEFDELSEKYPEQWTHNHPKYHKGKQQ